MRGPGLAYEGVVLMDNAATAVHLEALQPDPVMLGITARWSWTLRGW